MSTKERLQEFIDSHADEIGEVLPGGLKNAAGKWILVCPMMERFDLDFSKVNFTKSEELVEEVEKPKKSKKSKKK